MSRAAKNRRPRRPRRRGDAPAAPAIEPALTRAFTRRRFLSLIAAGSGMALAAPAPAAAAKKSSPPPAPAPAGPPAALRAEIEKQRKSVAGALKAVRDYRLPLGSDMAFEFRPIRRGPRK